MIFFRDKELRLPGLIGKRDREERSVLHSAYRPKKTWL